MSLLSHLQTQPKSPFARAASHEERVQFVILETKRLGKEAVKAMISKHDPADQDSTFHGLWVVLAAQLICDTDLILTYLQAHPSDMVRRRSAKALARLGQASALQNALSSDEVSANNKSYIVDLIMGMGAAVPEQVVDLVSKLRGTETALVLACRCGDAQLVQKYLLEPLQGETLPSHFKLSTRVEHAVRSAMRRIPSLAEDLVTAKLCPTGLQQLVLKSVGKKRLSTAGPDGSPSFLDIYIKCSHLDTAWFLANYVPDSQAKLSRYNFSEKANQSDLLLPICMGKEAFDDEFMWTARARNLKDPLGCLDLIIHVAVKRPTQITFAAAATHLKRSKELHTFIESDQNFPNVGKIRRRGVMFELVQGAYARFKTACETSDPEKRAALFCSEWSLPLLRSWMTEEQLGLVLSEFPHLARRAHADLPHDKAVSVLRTFLRESEHSEDEMHWGDATSLSEHFMCWLFTNAPDLFALQARRAQRCVPNFDLDSCPAWFLERLPYRTVHPQLKAACRVKEVAGVASRGDGLCGLLACAARSGGWALDNALEFMARSLRNERDDVRETVIDAVFRLLLPVVRAAIPPDEGESAWAPSEKRRRQAKSASGDKKRKTGGANAGAREKEEEEEGEDEEEDWMVVEIDEEAATVHGARKPTPAVKSIVEDSDVGALPRKEDEVLLGPRHTEVLDRLLMLTLQSKQSSGRIWLALARRILSRSLLFGEGPSSEMVRFARGVLTKLVDAKVVAEEAKVEELRAVHRILDGCPLYGVAKRRDGRPARGAYTWTADGKFNVKAAKAVPIERVEGETLMLWLVEETTDEVRRHWLRELLSASKDFARLVHSKRQDLLDPLVCSGPGQEIPATIVYKSVKNNRQGSQVPWRRRDDFASRQELADALAMASVIRMDGAQVAKEKRQRQLWQSGSEWDTGDGTAEAPQDFDWDAAGHFYACNVLLSSRPAYLAAMFRWHPQQQESFFDRWVLPAGVHSKLPLDLKTKARVLATSAGLLMAPNKLDKIASLLEQCKASVGDEEVDPAVRGFMGQVGDQLVQALGREDRPREAIEILVKHCFSGMSKGAIVQLGVVLRRVGLSTVESVIRGALQNKDVRVGGQVALARTTVALDLPRPELVLLQWSDAACHRDVAVALLNTLLRRPHLTEAHPQLLEKPLADLEAKLLRSPEPGVVAKGPESKTEFPVYVSSAFLAQLCKVASEGLINLGWLLTAAGKASLKFAIVAVDRCRGLLREKGVVALFHALCSIGLGSVGLKQQAEAAGAAVCKAIEDAFHMQESEGTGTDKMPVEDEVGSEAASMGTLYSLTSQLVVGLAHENWLGNAFVLRTLSSVLKNAVETKPGWAAAALAVSEKFVSETTAWDRLMPPAAKARAVQSWYDGVTAEVLKPLLSSVIHEGLGGAVGGYLAASLWVKIAVRANKRGASLSMVLDRLCDVCGEGELHPSLAQTVATAAISSVGNRTELTNAMSRLSAQPVRGGVRRAMLVELCRVAGDSLAPPSGVRQHLKGAVGSSDLGEQALAVDTWLSKERVRTAELTWAANSAKAARKKDAGTGAKVGKHQPSQRGKKKTRGVQKRHLRSGERRRR